jgi:hypothetical protein
MLKHWEVTYQIGTNPAHLTTCLTEGNQSTKELDSDLQKMIGIKRGVKPEAVRLVKVLFKH